MASAAFDALVDLAPLDVPVAEAPEAPVVVGGAVCEGVVNVI